MKVALLYLVAITIAELVTAVWSPLWGIAFHIFLLLVLVFHSSFATEHPSHRLYLALSLAPLIRVLSLSLPLLSVPQIYWYALTGIPLFGGAFIVMQRLNLRPRQVGLIPGKIPLQLLVATIGIPFGIAEYFILRPEPLVESLSWPGLLLPVLILFISTGLAEELIFRGVMQRLAGEALGRWGWVYVAVLFAVLHIGYISVLDVFFVLGAGLFFGWVVKRTGSLLGVTLAHGLTNILLYLVVPLLV